MSSEQMDSCCWQMAYDLLQDLEKGDLALINQRLQPLRQTLAARHGSTGAAFHAAGSLRLEQFDLLEGIAENLDASVEAIRRSSRPHLRRIQTAESLLRHLVSDIGFRSTGGLHSS